MDMRFALLFCVVVTARCSNDSDYSDVSKGPLVTHKVWFDIKIGDVDAGRIVIGLFGRTVPIAVRNFVNLARTRPYTGHKGGGFGYVNKNSDLGGGNTQCDSDYGETFPKENFKLKHYGAGWIGQISMGDRASSCRFYIILRPFPSVDGKNVVFGKVIKGMSVVYTIANTAVNENYHPKKEVMIENCGTELADPLFRVTRLPATD